MNHGNGRHQAERTGKRIAYRLSLVLNIVLVVGILAFGAVKVAPKIMAKMCIRDSYKSQRTGLPVELPLGGFASTDMEGEF